MTIEIQRPELEALIHEWMKSGAFQNVEDVLLQALKSAPLPKQQIPNPMGEKSPRMGSELVAAMQASPYKEICLEPERHRAPVSEPLGLRTVDQAIESIRELRKGNILGDENLKDLVHAGHKY